MNPSFLYKNQKNSLAGKEKSRKINNERQSEKQNAKNKQWRTLRKGRKSNAGK